MVSGLPNKHPEIQQVSGNVHAMTVRHRVNCTLSAHEYQQLRQAAATLRVKPTTLLKQAALDQLRKKRTFSPYAEKSLRALVIEIRRIGTNVNQLASKTNTLQKLSFSDLKTTQQRLGELEALLQKAITYYRGAGH